MYTITYYLSIIIFILFPSLIYSNDTNTTGCSSSSSHGRRLSGGGTVLCETYIPDLSYPTIYGIFVGSGFLLTILIFAIWYYRGYTERMERNRRRMSSFINPNTSRSSNASSSSTNNNNNKSVKGIEIAKLSYNITQYDDKNNQNASLADVYAINDIDDLFKHLPSSVTNNNKITTSNTTTDTNITTTSTTTRVSRAHAVALASRTAEAPVLT